MHVSFEQGPDGGSGFNDAVRGPKLVGHVVVRLVVIDPASLLAVVTEGVAPVFREGDVCTVSLIAPTDEPMLVGRPVVEVADHGHILPIRMVFGQNKGNFDAVALSLIDFLDHRRFLVLRILSLK